MVRVFLLLLLSFFVSILQLQAGSGNDSTEAQPFKKLATKMRLKNSKLKEEEYEVRIWNAQALRYGDAHMLYVLKKSQKSLVVSRYIIESDMRGFRYAIELKPTVPVTQDLWERLLQQDLLTLPDQAAIEHQLYPRERKDSTWTTIEPDGNVSVHARMMREEDQSVIIADGEGYYFEIFSRDGYRGYGYSNPRDYFKYKPKISELRKVVTILNNLTVLFYSSK